MEWLTHPEAWLALFTLTALEIVLGIDNIVFISILVGRLPPANRQKGRLVGLSLAMFSRLALLFTLTWIMKLSAPLFHLFGQGISGRQIIFILGGLFLLAKSVLEIHHALEHAESKASQHNKIKHGSFWMIMMQIAIIDIVFSLDSVITAVGMANHISIMVLAIIISVVIMMFAAKSIGNFIDAHPTIKMLALSFLILIGVMLIGEGLDQSIPKGYIYFAMLFSLFVEFLNIRLHKKQQVIKLHKGL
jgi:predicted tellurium resistance membrane protein TerC